MRVGGGRGRRPVNALDEALEGLLVPEGIVCMEKAHARMTDGRCSDLDEAMAL